MQKDNRYYTFLLSHTTKERIYIRRLEISKKLAHTTLASSVLCFGLMSIGMFSILDINNNFVADLIALPQAQSPASLQTSIPVKRLSKQTPIDYSRPQSSMDYVTNSGGPSDYRLIATESTKEEEEIERKLRAIEATSSPESLPTIWAHLGKINNEFGFRRNPFGGRSYEFHAGMDIDGDKGDLIVSPARGIVTNAGWKGGYGNLIEIDHGNGLTTRYGHLSKVETREGDVVQRGQLIGLVGSTGRSTGPHLHYELRLNKKPINPRRFLPLTPNKIEK